MHSGGAPPLPAIPYASSPNPPTLLPGFASAKLAIRSLRLPDQVNPSALHLLSLGAQQRGREAGVLQGRAPHPRPKRKLKPPFFLL